ncbi:MAG: hypothetical protein NTZ51_10980 [Proteobacteria bacterium]|nr:hypothetical protein [Pseudomonadota bacterium]
MPLIIFFIFIILLNLLLNKKVRDVLSSFKISFLISVVCTAIFQVLAYIQLGYLDPFFIIAVIVQLISAFIAGGIINLIFLKIKKAKGIRGKGDNGPLFFY